jgi:CheY-like chemotaxis protein
MNALTAIATATHCARLPILVVEDSPQWKLAFEVLLSQHPEKFTLLGVAETTAEAIALLKATPNHPHDIVMILDWELPAGQTGLDVFKTIAQTVGMNASQVVLVSGTPPHELPVLPFEQIPKLKAGQYLISTLLARWAAFQQNADGFGQQATA